MRVSSLVLLSLSLLIYCLMLLQFFVFGVTYLAPFHFYKAVNLLLLVHYLLMLALRLLVLCLVLLT